MLALDHITVQYGDRVLLDDVSCMIGPHDRIGLVGSNGTGKSTLLKILAGLQQPDGGGIQKARFVTVGYLPQDGVAAAGKTLYQEVETAFEDVLQVQQKLDEAQHSLAMLDPSRPEYADTLEVFGELQHQLEDLDAFRMKSKIERVLMGLGFSVNDFERLTDEFSGGWQMRIALVKLLLQQPSLLLLDEPTNHLDLESLQWLEEYLQQYDGAIVIVSHDRAFLDTLTTRTLALRFGNLDEYAGNYSFYVREEVARKALLQSAQKNQQKHIKQTQEFIDRFRYKASKARQVQSRIKMLEKVELVELEDEEKEIRFRFPQPQPSGRVVIELKSIRKSYGSNRIFDGLTYRIERGDRIAVVGVNGAGKSTFARLLAGVEPLDDGERIPGHNMILSYFAQHQAEELNDEKNVLQIVEEVATGETRQQLRTLLGSFLFRGDDVWKQVRVLSGGEKSRLALAKMLLQPANFLIMDEPTNHLDMKSKTILQAALSEYDGTYVIVSHDRAFLDPLVNKVVEFSPGRVNSYLGTVTEYLARKKREHEQSARNSSASQSRKVGPNEKERKRSEAAQRQLRSQLLRPLREKLASVERSIEQLEGEKQQLEAALTDPEVYKDGELVKQKSTEYKTVQQQLNDAYFEWNAVSEKIARAEQDP
jgi:ATP-binding cassette subfamily F protein 3